MVPRQKGTPCKDGILRRQTISEDMIHCLGQQNSGNHYLKPYLIRSLMIGQVSEVSDPSVSEPKTASESVPTDSSHLLDFCDLTVGFHHRIH